MNRTLVKTLKRLVREQDNNIVWYSGRLSDAETLYDNGNSGYSWLDDQITRYQSKLDIANDRYQFWSKIESLARKVPFRPRAN